MADQIKVPATTTFRTWDSVKADRAAKKAKYDAVKAALSNPKEDVLEGLDMLGSQITNVKALVRNDRYAQAGTAMAALLGDAEALANKMVDLEQDEADIKRYDDEQMAEHPQIDE